MAEYIRSNYEQYKKSLGAQKKADFLRTMRNVLGLQCSNSQIKNGFQSFLKKYTDVKTKLGLSGFGVDPEKDATLNKGWILRNCPYYFVLDEVMGTRPNVNPPFVLATTISNASVPSDVDVHCDADQLSLDEDENMDDIAIPDNEEHLTTNVSPSQFEDEPITTPTTQAPNDEASTSYYVRKTLSGIRPKRDDISKTPMSIFAAAMNAKTEENVRVEREKIQMTQAHFAAEMDIRKEQNAIEQKKVDSQIELESKKLELEEKRLQDKADERKHELEKIRLQQEHELKRLELELKLKNA